MRILDALEEWVWRRREARAKRWLANSPLRTRLRPTVDREMLDRWRKPYQLPEWTGKKEVRDE